MKHRIKQKKLNRKTGHRNSTLSNLACSLIEHEQIKTTVVKAKALKPYVEKLITLGKQGDLPARKRALSQLPKKEVVQKLFSEIAEKFKTRNGGYTRVMKFGHRKGDCADVAIIELVDRTVEAKGKADLARVAKERAEAASAA